MIKIFKLSNREFKILSTFRSLKTSSIISNQNTNTNFNENDNYEEPCELPPVVPSIVKRDLLESVSCSNSHVKPKQAWLETLKCPEDRKLGLLDLHPDIFGTFPRLDLINLNLRWQGVYRFVDWRKITTRPEVNRTGKKMWPQKGTGRARHGDRTAPQFIGGAQVKGPMGPRAYFSVLPIGTRLHGLTSTLSIKLFQDDLHIVDDLNLPNDDKDYLINLIEGRNWGKSVLFVNSTDEAPRNIAKICSMIPHYMVIPAYAVNVWSLIKYDTVILTLPSLNIIEEKLITSLTALVPDMKSIRSSKHFRKSNHDSWDQRQNTNFRGNPATHDDHIEYQ